LHPDAIFSTVVDYDVIDAPSTVKEYNTNDVIHTTVYGLIIHLTIYNIL